MPDEKTSGVRNAGVLRGCRTLRRRRPGVRRDRMDAL